MELHYLTLKRHAEYLNFELRGGLILDSYTQQKNEQILQIELPGGQRKQLILSADAAYPFVLLKPPGKRARISTDVIPDLLNQEISGIHMLDQERVIVIKFQGSSNFYNIQLFRNRANFFLINQQHTILDAFKKQKKYVNQPYSLKSKNLFNPFEMESEQFANILFKNSEAPLDYLLKRNFIFMSPLVIREVSERCQINNKSTISIFSNDEIELLFKEIQSFLKECHTNEPRVYLDKEYPHTFALTEMKHLEQLNQRKFETLNDALSFFIFRRQKIDRKYKKSKKIETALEKKLSQITHAIRQVQQMPDESDRRTYYQKIGELLLSQMYQISSGQEEVELIDYYDPEQRLIRVNLNSQLSIQENAENYFKKAKETKNKSNELQERLNYLERQKRELETIQRKLMNETDFKDLLKFEKRLKELRVLQPVGEKLEESYRPYKQYFYQDWEIWVGKNAKANDQMTLKFAHKEDSWLHAQGVGGSHVVIHKHNRNSQIPKQVVEYAAQLAAGNSAAKHSSYVPVMVTQVKYVRKPKGAAPGAVIPERTKTVFVEPLI